MFQNNNHMDELHQLQRELLFTNILTEFYESFTNQMNTGRHLNYNSPLSSIESMRDYWVNILQNSFINEASYHHDHKDFINKDDMALKLNDEGKDKGEDDKMELPFVIEASKSTDCIVESSSSMDKLEEKERLYRSISRKRKRETADEYQCEKNHKVSKKSSRKKLTSKTSNQLEKDNSLSKKEEKNSLLDKAIFHIIKYKKSSSRNDFMEKNFPITNQSNLEYHVIDLDERTVTLEHCGFELLKAKRNPKHLYDTLPQKVWSYKEYNNCNDMDIAHVLKEIEGKWPRITSVYREDLILQIMHQFHFNCNKALEFFNSKFFLNWIKGNGRDSNTAALLNY